MGFWSLRLTSSNCTTPDQSLFKAYRAYGDMGASPCRRMGLIFWDASLLPQTLRVSNLDHLMLGFLSWNGTQFGIT
jgi:hypothetical protein